MKETILVVDDDADDREILRDAFMKASRSIDCVCIESGPKLVEYLRNNLSAPPALILLDLNMPGKDGRDTLMELKSDPALQPIPTIVLTTSASPRDKSTCYALGASSFITKPDTFDKLMDMAGCMIKLWVTGWH